MTSPAFFMAAVCAVIVVCSVIAEVRASRRRPVSPEIPVLDLRSATSDYFKKTEAGTLERPASQTGKESTHARIRQ